MQLNYLPIILPFLLPISPGADFPPVGNEGDAEMLQTVGQGMSKLANERITSEAATVNIRKGDSRFAQKLQHEDMMGAMHQVNPSHVYLVNAVFLKSVYWMPNSQ